MTYRIKIFVNDEFFQEKKEAIQEAKKENDTKWLEIYRNDLKVAKRWKEKGYEEVNTLAEYFALLDKVEDITCGDYTTWNCGRMIEF